MFSDGTVPGSLVAFCVLILSRERSSLHFISKWDEVLCTVISLGTWKWIWTKIPQNFNSADVRENFMKSMYLWYWAPKKLVNIYLNFLWRCGVLKGLGIFTMIPFRYVVLQKQRYCINVVFALNLFRAES